MTNTPPPGKKRIADWLGMRVKSNCTLTNGYGSMPPGTVWTVESAFHGLDLKSDVCHCCGLQMRVRKVPTKDVAPA